MGDFILWGFFLKGLCMEVLIEGFISIKRQNPPGTKAPWVKNPLGQNPPIIIIRGFCPTFMFGGFCPKGFCLWGVLSEGFCLRGVLSQGGSVLPPSEDYQHSNTDRYSHKDPMNIKIELLCIWDFKTKIFY